MVDRTPATYEHQRFELSGDEARAAAGLYRLQVGYITFYNVPQAECAPLVGASPLP